MTNLPASRTTAYIRLQLRIDELPPQPRAHLQAVLLAPVVAEVDGVDVVLQRLADLGEVVVGDPARAVRGRSAGWSWKSIIRFSMPRRVQARS